MACPVDRTSPLLLTADEALQCPTCGATYAIEAGIPRMLPPADARDREEVARTEKERAQRDREARRYDANRMLRVLSVAEIPLTLQRLASRPDDVVVEIGCGTGRVTGPLSGRCGEVWALDHSFDSLCVAREKVDDERVRFVQADAGYLPLRDGLADRALSCQMLEHLPSPGLRERAVAEAARVLKPGGAFVLSAYWHSPLTRLLGDQQGYHSGMIYYYRFTRPELQELLERAFSVEGITRRLVYILLAACRKKILTDTHGTGFSLH